MPIGGKENLFFFFALDTVRFESRLGGKKVLLYLQNAQFNLLLESRLGAKITFVLAKGTI